MGLDIGIMKVEYLARPKGVVYDFAWHLAQEGALDSYMFGEGNSWIPFTQRQVLRMFDEFTRERRLSPTERLEVRSWIESLPWVGWEDALPPPPRDPDDDEDDGGIIELHFNW